jgi:hypothetical protein
MYRFVTIAVSPKDRQTKNKFCNAFVTNKTNDLKPSIVNYKYCDVFGW